jgi:hypothetical protein
MGSRIDDLKIGDVVKVVGPHLSNTHIYHEKGIVMSFRQYRDNIQQFCDYGSRMEYTSGPAYSYVTLLLGDGTTIEIYPEDIEISK